jgi:predicted ferric reductase
VDHVFWYTSRAAGIAAYLLLSLSVVWGLVLSTGWFQQWFKKPAFYEAHRLSSLFVVGFIGIHVAALAGDQYVDWSPMRLLVPFTSEYRPFWTAVGIISMYITVLVVASFYARRWIGQRAWRRLHYASFIAYVTATAHGLYAGTDTGEIWMRWLYLSSVFLVVLLLDIRILTAGYRRAVRPPRAAVRAAVPTTSAAPTA